MSQGRPRPAQSRKLKQDPGRLRRAADDLVGGLFERPTRPDSDFRLLKGGGSGFVKDPAYALGKSSRHPTRLDYHLGGKAEEEAREVEEVRDEPEPESITAEDQRWITAEVRLREQTRDAEVSVESVAAERDRLTALLATYEALARRKGMNIRSDVRVVERRLQELDRKLGIDRTAA